MKSTTFDLLRANTLTLPVAICTVICCTGNAAEIISSLGTTFTEDLDSFAGTTASLPANFAWSNTDFTPGGIYDAAGAYHNRNSTFALVLNNSSERAFGSKRDTSSILDSLDWEFTNATGATISGFIASWDVEQYSVAGRATSIDFGYNPGGGFTQTGIVGTTLTAASTAGTAANLSSIAVTSRSVSIPMSTPLPNGANIQFRWDIGNGLGASSNAHIGVDNLRVTAVPEPSAFLLLGLLGLTSLAIKRIRNSSD